MSKRRILFEAGPMLDARKSGVGYYVNHLVNALQEYYGEQLELTGFYFNFLNRHVGKEPAGSKLGFHKIQLVPGKFLSLCRRLGFQPFLEAFVQSPSDVVLFTNYVSLPVWRHRKIALVIYDLSFLDTPEFMKKVNRRYLRKFCPPSIRRADVIITISEFTKQRLEYHFPNLKARVVVTPIPPPEKVTVQPGLSQRLLDQDISKGQYILYVGTIEPRKNLAQLIEAYARLDAKLRQRYSLVLAGGKGWLDEPILSAIEKYKATGLNIILPGYVSDAEKIELYSNAACFVLPSHYEGFGMPILEAMQQRAPVLVSDIPVFHEVAGDAALYFNKDDVLDIAKKVAQILSDPKLADSLQAKSEMQLRKFSWRENAKIVYKVLQ